MTAETTARPRALIVEDEFFIALDLADRLEALGWSVVTIAATVSGALASLDRERPDIALLDINIEDGLVTPVAARLQAREVPFVLMSADDKAGDRMAREFGASNLGKPLNEQALIDFLDAARDGIGG